MPVTETLEFEQRLVEKMGIGASAIVANGIYPQRFTGAEAKRIKIAAADAPSAKTVRAALDVALAEHARARVQHSQLRRLRTHAQAPVSTLPYLFGAELGLEQFDRLSRELGRRL